MTAEPIPKTQTVALVRQLGGPVEFQHDYPVPTPGPNEVLAKVLYTGVCQSGELSHQIQISEKDEAFEIQRLMVVTTQTSTPKAAPPPVQTAIPSQRSSCLTLAGTKALAASWLWAPAAAMTSASEAWSAFASRVGSVADASSALRAWSSTALRAPTICITRMAVSKSISR